MERVHLQNAGADVVEDRVQKEGDEFEEEGGEKGGADLDAENKQQKEDQDRLQREGRGHSENETHRNAPGYGLGRLFGMQQFYQTENLL